MSSGLTDSMVGSDEEEEAHVGLKDPCGTMHIDSVSKAHLISSTKSFTTNNSFPI